MICMFCPVRQVIAAVGCHTILFGHDRQMAALEAKSAVSDCILLTKKNEALGYYHCD